MPGKGRERVRKGVGKWWKRDGGGGVGVGRAVGKGVRKRREMGGKAWEKRKRKVKIGKPASP
jgi:hypothetical protein